MASKEPKTGREAVEINPQTLPFGNNGLEVPAIYADHIRGTFVAMGMVKINLVENRMDTIAEEMRAITVATIILPASQLGAWGRFLTKTAEELGTDAVEQTEQSDADPRS